MMAEVRFYLALFLRRFHYFLIVVVLSTAAAVYVARSLPTTYAAEARLLVEAEQIPGNLAASTVRINPNTQLEIIQQRILTRDVLIDMANRLNIYAAERRRGEPPLAGDEIVDDLRSRIRINVSSARQRGTEQATVVRISFNAPTGQLAADVTNEMVTLVQAEDVSIRTRTARETLEFFEQKVEQLDRALSVSSAEVLAFQEANITALPDSLDFRRNQQASAQERLLQIERQVSELRDRRDRIAQVFESTGTLEGVDGRRSESPEMQQLRALKEQRAQLLAVLSPENPRVRVLNRQIETLETVVSEQSTLDENGNPANSGTASALTAFEIQLLDLDGQIEFLQSQSIQIQDEIARLSQSIAETPGNAVALGALERNHASILSQYNEAVANLAKAETGDTIEGLSKGQRISIIETAIAPREPNSPDRRKIAMAGAGGGVMLGFGIVALLELLRTGIRRPVDLTRGLGITPFATLPYLHSRKEIVRRRVLVWGGVVAILGGAAVAVWAIDTFYMPIDRIVELIQQRLR